MRSPWAKLTMSMIPKMSVRPEATIASTIPLTRPWSVWMMIWSMSDPQVLVDDALVGSQLGRRGMVPYGALLHDVDAPGGVERQRDVLLDEKNGHPVPVKRVHDLLDLGDHPGHEPFGGLVEQDDLRLEHHRARDGEHLLLAARQRPARLTAPLSQDREVAVDLLEQLLAALRRDSGPVEPRAEILEHRQQAEDPTLLRHPRDAQAGQPVGRHAGQVPPVERDPPARPAHHSHDRLERRGLAHAVAAEQADHLARAHLDRHAVQDV